jgi:hypothetical protein
MLTRAHSARGGGTSSLNTPSASNLGFSTECLTPQCHKTQVLSSKRGGSSSSLSDCPTSVSSSKMASSPGQDYADDKLDKMLLFLQNI